MGRPREVTRIGESNKLISVKELAERCDISPDTVYDQWRAWGLSAYRIGKHLRFRERDIEAWIDRQAA